MTDRRNALAALALCTACSGVAPDLTSVPHAAPDGNLAGSEFPGADALLAGFDERSENASWETGDRVLFGLRLRKGEQVQRWLLHLQVDLTTGRAHGEGIATDEPDGLAITLSETQTWTYTATAVGEPKQLQVSSPMQRVNVTVADEHGVTLGQAKVALPSRLLSAGLLPAVELSLALGSGDGSAEAPPFREEHVRPMVEAVLGMMSLLNVVREDKVLADYFWQVVEKPGVWSVITSFGIAASLRIPFEKSVPAARLPGHLPPLGRAFVVPLQVDVNANPALLVDIVATQAARPYALCGGMVAATARHPTDPSVQFEVVLLAARRGPTVARARIEMPPLR